MKTIFLHLILYASFILPQQFTNVEIVNLTNEINEKLFYPILSPDGLYVYASSEDYSKIYRINLDSKQLELIIEEAGAGYQFSFSNSGDKIFYRTTLIANGRIYSALKVFNLTIKESTLIEDYKRFVSPPTIDQNDNMIYTIEDNINVLSSSYEKTFSSSPYVTIENQIIALYQNDEKKLLKPLGDGNYIWVSVSPDGEKLLFTFAGFGTYISDLNGNIITELGYANAPKWSPDGNWVAFMNDKDDGHHYVSSEIFVVNINNAERIKLTDSSHGIAMYPNWSSDGKKIIFNNDEGEIFVIKLNEEY